MWIFCFYILTFSNCSYIVFVVESDVCTLHRLFLNAWMLMKSKLGSVNPCEYAILIGVNGRNYGYTLDTPNAIACAMANNPKIYKAVAHYPLFGDKITLRTDLEDRFWFTRDDATLKSYYRREVA